MSHEAIERAKEHFGKLLEEQFARVERIKAMPDWTDYAQLKPVIVGILGGDGIGPFIAKESKWVLTELMRDEIAAGKIELRDIEGLTIERRAARRPAPSPTTCWPRSSSAT